MGYMGLGYWGDSDNAADFRYTLQEVFKKHGGKKTLKAAVRKLIMEELKNQDNCYNTAGPVNVALVMEDEGSPAEYEDDSGTPAFSKLLSKKEFTAILNGLKKLIEACGAEDQQDSNTVWHCKNFERMKKSVYRKTYKE